MTRVKICGITRPEDALLAERLGAWAVGFILVPGTKRYRPPEHARRISEQLGPFICRVGVFQDSPPEAVLAHMAQAKLQVVQFHGFEPPAWAEEVRRHYPLIKAFKLSGPADAAMLEQALTYPCDALMLDGVNPGSGQGYPLAWLEPFLGHPRLIVAGGLNPENLPSVLALQPYAVDVSSGVEESPGVKDGQKVRSFLDVVSRSAQL